ncbi:amino acid ABC transporter substrate-binding protein [Psychromonas sp. 14N.309.X.WAT.B.A12]|jgi:putative S-methylcysteine transport system substrate-binding protein|uniref:amino acid ABC transporter substrate-binding protein n=1 Tax=unclassified Psychromonas TaxID=2614957 RepID=UPI0025B1DB43|nr:amino acid ABC transporter substrate-binding protein [Psychromonas sp. 14N.309.X.WAT.B.A12]MDN2662237.1 amino acid ABC transporter substrate-binding protein [Psychromonas sp. 14N.309.X.WAT.B.A12]
MKLFFKKALIAFVAASSLLTVPAFAQETVKVGMSGRYFPFTFSKQDKLQGFEVDVWNEIAKRSDYKVEFITASFSGLFGMLEAGHIDTISNQITITEARSAKYAFSTPYVIDGVQVTVRKGRDDIQGIEDLKGKKVAVNLGSNFEEVLRKYDTNNEINIVTYDTGIEQDVALGRADAFVMDRVSSVQLIKEAGLPLQLAGHPFEEIKNAMPFLNKPSQLAIRDQVNTALAAMRADGKLAEISDKWFGTDITQ